MRGSSVFDTLNPRFQPRRVATMRIAHCIRVVAVLYLTALFHSACPSAEHLNTTIFRTRRSTHDHLWYKSYKQNWRLQHAGKYLSPRENQMLLREESKNMTAVDCCPSVLEMVEPEAGVNQNGEFVELYRDGDNRQRFYELSCHKDILNKSCRFMDKKLHNNSKCVQKHSYTYAIVKDPGGSLNGRPSFPSFHSGPGETRWTLDYIRVRSGCSCVVTPNIKKKRDRLKHKRIRHEDTGQ